jgi:hypothetical protein
MPLFDAPNADTHYPTKWNEYSLDFRFMFVYHGSMMVLFVTGGILSLKEELIAAALLLVILASLSIRHRNEANWRWPGARTKDVLAAIGVVVVAAIFDLAAVPLFPPSNPRFLPWHLAGLGIAAFGALVNLKVIQFSKADFLKECEAVGIPVPPKPVVDIIATPIDSLWKRVARGVYATSFFLVWLDFVASFYYFGVSFRDGSPRPTPTRTEPLSDHGQVVFIPHSQKALLDLLQGIAAIGIPSVIGAGLILHFFIGVRLFPNMPTFQEWKKQRLKA